jgi:hypothetical protein
MTEEYKATPEQWAHQETWLDQNDADAACLLELRSRVEALEEAFFSSQGLKSCLSRCMSPRGVCAKRVQPAPGSSGGPAVSLATSSSDDHGQRVREGLRRALKGGKTLGGLRPARSEENKRIHLQALKQALEYRDVIERGHDKSLSALSRDLFEAGCCTRSDKPLTPEMVRRLRIRLEEAKQAIEAGDLEDEWAENDRRFEAAKALIDKPAPAPADSLVDRVAATLHAATNSDPNVPANEWRPEARAAIREVAEWLRLERQLPMTADVLEQDADDD